MARGWYRKHHDDGGRERGESGEEEMKGHGGLKVIQKSTVFSDAGQGVQPSGRHERVRQHEHER